MIALLLLALLIPQAGAAPDAPRFFKGNTHTHTLWSDGDAAPEVAAAWYREHGYQFLVLSDHNILSEDEKWFEVETIEQNARSRLTPERLRELRERFGAEQVEVREVDGRTEMRLKTLDELKARFERPGKFLFIQGEEVTDRYDPRSEGVRRLEVHINALNTSERIAPQGGDSPVEVLNRNVDAIVAHGAQAGRPVLAHINHPNFGWSLTWRDVAAVAADRFFEVYNGHKGTNSAGDAEHDSMDTLWDRALTLRLTELGLGVLYGVATDDSHNYHGPGQTSVPGRGFVMVRAAELTPDAVIGAMKRGEFYASTGVVVREFGFDEEGYRVTVAPRAGEHLKVRFVGTRLLANGAAGEVGATLQETVGAEAVYVPTGDLLYVRAVVLSDRPLGDPTFPGETERAWLQPVVLAR